MTSRELELLKDDFLSGNSHGKVQKDGTLGVNRAKKDYLLQPFQNGKLLMINVPLPRDSGKCAT